MFRLTRQVRFSVNTEADSQLSEKPGNSFGGFPSLTGLGRWFTLDVTLRGEIDPTTSYLRNIKEIDDVVRRLAVPLVADSIASSSGENLIVALHKELRDAWEGSKVDRLTLSLSPFLTLSIFDSEFPMIRLSEKFEFSASHRLHNPELSETENREFFGKCNNPMGHGHNYEVQVTLRGRPNASGKLVNIPELERLVTKTVIDRYDHRNLNQELPEFREMNPTVENIARMIYGLLKIELASSLASVTVWETPKTWCEYGEE